MLEATRFTIAWTCSASSVVPGEVSTSTDAVVGVLLVGEDLLLGGIARCTTAVLTPSIGLDGVGQLALHRPLEVGLLLELGRRDVLFVEQPVAAVLLCAGRPLPAERDRVA